MITITVPVGPFPANKRWLPEALNSCLNQTHRPDEILIVDDQANLSVDDFNFLAPYRVVTENGEPRIWAKDVYIRIWRTPWHSGVSHAFNFGVALARNDLIFMLGSDDYLAPECLERCIKVWEKNDKKDAYYYVPVRYLDDREENLQGVPCGAAMVTKGLWYYTGGFPLEAAVGQSDSMLVSILWKHHHEMLVGVGVEGTRPLYYYRPHDESDTASKGPWQGVLLETKNLVTALWVPRK